MCSRGIGGGFLTLPLASLCCGGWPTPENKSNTQAERRSCSGRTNFLYSKAQFYNVRAVSPCGPLCEPIYRGKMTETQQIKFMKWYIYLLHYCTHQTFTKIKWVSTEPHRLITSANTNKVYWHCENYLK